MTNIELKQNLRLDLYEKLSNRDSTRKLYEAKVKHNAKQGIIRGAKVGLEGIRNIISGSVSAVRGSIPGIKQATAGTMHAATGVSMMTKHAARGIRPIIRKRPLTSIGLAAAIGAAGGYGLSKALQSKPNSANNYTQSYKSIRTPD